MATMASETTPLVPPKGAKTPSNSISGSKPTAYFLDRTHRRNSSTTSRGGDSFATPTGQEVDSMPAGGVAAEFDSRPVSGRNNNIAPSGSRRRRHMKASSVGGGWLDYVPDSWKGGRVSAASPLVREGGANASAGIGTLVLPRKVPLKVEPKVHFANERTFLAWLHLVLVLAAASLMIVTYSTDESLVAQLYGIVLLPVSVAYIFYALWQFLRRSMMIKHRQPGPYIDIVGPTTLTIIMMASISAQFCLKLHSMMNE